jgi:large subunit ribosomal protein L22
MEIVARNDYLRVSLKKLSPVANLVRGKGLIEALNILNVCNVKGAKILILLLNSAMKNAVSNFAVGDISKLYVREIMLGRARFLKRFQPRARGRGNRILKHASNARIVLSVL